MLETKADRECKAEKCERIEDRQDTSGGDYQRNLQIKAGEASSNMLKLRRQAFATSIIVRYRLRESSVDEALIEMYLDGVLVRRTEDITEALWGGQGQPGDHQQSEKKVYKHIEASKTGGLGCRVSGPKAVGNSFLPSWRILLIASGHDAGKTGGTISMGVCFA